MVLLGIFVGYQEQQINGWKNIASWEFITATHVHYENEKSNKWFTELVRMTIATIALKNIMI